MSKIISIHSFRGGTGKSNTTANLAALLAMDGFRVGIVDTDIQSPGIHVIFGMDDSDMKHSLNDYLWGKCDIKDAAHDVTGKLGADVKGQLFLIPSSIKAGEIARILREGYDVGLLTDGFRDLVDKLELDYLLIDTHPGLNEETLLSMAISQALIIIMRPDSQDYQGTAVTVDIARKLDVPNMLMVVNKTPQAFELEDVRERVEKSFNCEVVSVIPHSEEMMVLASSELFVVRYPDDPVTKEFRIIVDKIKA
ncbi:MAG: MinD/ParA family protein [Anaerolineae bacterium]|nr:MinD/ParA family protein [Anaerolineae bacterium]MDK1081803.1 MinD/ParA family protein [Anaerolineae bacterium]MDK1117806.1 MinD/ParA family protein [Anaerolineae bacterium]